MALDLSTKIAELEAVDAAIGLLNSVKQAGEVPKKEVFKRTHPQFALNDILFIISNIGNVSSQEELKEKIDQVLEKLELLRKTLAAQPEGAVSISTIPEEVRAHPKFFGLPAQDVLNELEAARLKVKAAQNEEWVRDFSLPEKPHPNPTFYLSPQNPPEPQPVYETPASMLVENGLVSVEGVVDPNYFQKLENLEFKQKIEAEIKKAVLEEHLEESLSQNLVLELARWSWVNKLTAEERVFIVKSIGKEYTKEVTSILLSSVPENLPTTQQEAIKKLKERFSQERGAISEFLDAVFLVNINFQNPEVRKTAIEEALGAIYQALLTFEMEIVETKLDVTIPKLVISYFKLIDGKLVRQDLDYYIVPKSPAELEASYQATRTEVETLLKVLFEKNKVRPTAPSFSGNLEAGQ